MTCLWNRTTWRIGLLVCVVCGAITPSADGQILGSLSEEEEVELGRMAAVEIEKDLNLLTDEEVVAYVSDLGETLAEHSNRTDLTYQFKVVDAAEINAFALPGGFIYVHRGLIEAANTEAELVGVLGHEIAHVVARHGAEQAQRASIADLGLRVPGSIFGRGTGGRIGAMAAEMAAGGTFMQFSRDAEREADRLGAENVAAAGQNPQGMITFFEKLDALRERQANAVESFFASHPSPAERVSNIQDLVVSLSEGKELTLNGARFREVKARLAELPPPPSAPVPADTRELASSTRTEKTDADPVEVTYPGDERDYEIASRFAPVFYQALGSSPRHDYITRFDFDGDWRGDNNWDNAGDERHALPATVYFNVSETTTHYFVHYAVFHPRDYKGEYRFFGKTRGVLVAVPGRHENDMEGTLVVAQKSARSLDGAQVVYVETLAHNQFLQYEVPRGLSGLFARRTNRVRLDGEHPELYIEPKGHGIEAYQDGRQSDDIEGFVVYRYAGVAEEASATRGPENVGYALVSMAESLWPRAGRGVNRTYGGTFDYGTWTIRVAEHGREVTEWEVTLGEIGSTFRGIVGGRDMARPPWGWFDRDERDRRQGEWFLTPAETVKRHFGLGEAFSMTYVHHPLLGVIRD